jgi:hypothetical protein
MAKTPERALALLEAGEVRPRPRRARALPPAGQAARGHVLAERLRERIFSVGNTVDNPAEAYRSFRGRDASFEPLLRKRGFPVPEPLKD